ncbi:MAG: hypothetical protein L6Q37_11790 [Bdellovibrionaceae bacterium]|nr:hypothetical protein [Pseudobdellovibrionaceae bacterium]
MPAKKNIIKLNQNGFLTIDFSFAILFSVGISVIFFVLAFTLSTAEIAQYIAFSIGRTYSAGHVNRESQKELANLKWNQLMNQSRMGKLFKQGWFELSKDNPFIRSGHQGEIFTGYTSQPEGLRLITTGVRLVFKTNLFDLKLGNLGSTNPTGETFTAKVTGFMMRNPNQEECQNFMEVQKRHRAIIELDKRYQNYDRSPGSNEKYAPMEDNGC